MTESKADELRRLAAEHLRLAAALDAAEDETSDAWGEAYDRALPAFHALRDALHTDDTDEAARAIIAAIDDATEQGRAAGDAEGYARAMRQTATYAEREAVACFSPLSKSPAKGDAFERVARWCREHVEVSRG